MTVYIYDSTDVFDLNFEDYHSELAMSTHSGIRVKMPVHPGSFIKCEIIEAEGLSITQAASILGVTRPALSAVLNERAALSPEMALRVEKAFGVSMDTLMRMQNSFVIAKARAQEDQISVARYVSQAAAATG